MEELRNDWKNAAMISALTSTSARSSRRERAWRWVPSQPGKSMEESVREKATVGQHGSQGVNKAVVVV
jgi:hypothetical protein